MYVYTDIRIYARPYVYRVRSKPSVTTAQYPKRSAESPNTTHTLHTLHTPHTPHTLHILHTLRMLLRMLPTHPHLHTHTTPTPISKSLGMFRHKHGERVCEHREYQDITRSSLAAPYPEALKYSSSASSSPPPAPEIFYLISPELSFVDISEDRIPRPIAYLPSPHSPHSTAVITMAMNARTTTRALRALRVSFLSECIN